VCLSSFSIATPKNCAIQNRTALGDVARVILRQEGSEPCGAKVLAFPDAFGQRGQERAAVRKLDALPQIARGLGLKDQFLDKVFLIAQVNRAVGGVGKRYDPFAGDR